MAGKIIDLSIPIETKTISDPPMMKPEIQYLKHNNKESIGQILDFFPGLRKEDLPDEESWSTERLKITTHNGTHLDAPYHFHSTTNNGMRAITIDEVPLEWCFQPGVKLDLRHFEDGYLVTADDIKNELDRIEHSLKPLEIVIVNTKAGKQYGKKDYLISGCGMGKDATLFLLEQGIKITGTDAWSWDVPFIYTAKKYKKTNDPSIIWEGHKAGKEMEYCHIEKLHNLEELPSTGFTISCFPVKIANASAGWTRAVAILDS